MEMDYSVETNMPYLGLGRQGFGLGSGDVEYQVSSSSYCPPLSIGNKRRVDEAEFWHGSNTCDHDSWRTNACEPSQMQQLPGIQRPKRQNCTSLMSTQWDAQHGISGTLDDGSSRPGLDMEGSLGLSSRLGLTGYSSATNHGLINSNLDFCHSRPVQSGSNNRFLSYFTPAGPSNRGIISTTRNNLEENNVGGWRESAGLQSLGIRQEDARSTMPRHLDPLLSTCPSSLPGSEGGKPLLPTVEFVGNSADNSGAKLGNPHGGRRSFYRRESSTAGITSSLAFRTSHSSGRRESNFGRLASRGVSNSLDIGNSTCAAAISADYLQRKTTDSVGHMWEDPHNPQGILIGGENDSMLEYTRGNTETSLPFRGIHEASQSSVHMRALSLQPEQTLSQLHSPFTRSLRRFFPVSRSQTWSSYVPSAEQPVESIDYGIGSNTAVREADPWSASVISQRTGNDPIPGSWSRSPLFSRGNDYHTGIFETPRVPSLFEGNRTRNFSTGTASWLGATDNRLVSQMGLDPTNRTFTASTTRVVNASENHSRAYQAGTNSLIYPDLAASRPHLSTLAPAGRNRRVSQGSMISSPTSSSSSENRDSNIDKYKSSVLKSKFDRKNAFKTAPTKRLTEEQRDQYLKENKCYHCGKLGHKAFECPEKNKAPDRDSKLDKDKSSVLKPKFDRKNAFKIAPRKRLTEEQRDLYLKEKKCYRCGKLDHKASKCPEKNKASDRDSKLDKYKSSVWKLKFHKKAAPTPPTKRLPKELKNQYRKENKCYNCGKLDHKAFECREKNEAPAAATTATTPSSNDDEML